MIICCTEDNKLCGEFSCKVEKSEKGVLISLEGDDPEKIKALQNMLASCQTLCCGSEKKESCC